MEIDAPAHWRCVDFISDLHLQASDIETFGLWRQYLLGTPADAVFMLGDLFEVWVGDDALSTQDGFEARCADVMRNASQKSRLYIMHGNRDFLMGQQLMQACDAQLMADPTVLNFAGQRWLLAHGDALCLADLPYQEFRAAVRSERWQTDFLSKPLTDRQALARGIRAQSEARKREEASYIDLDETAVIASLQLHQAETLVHGHTHRPGIHAYAKGLQRIVLSDWDALARPPRAEVLRIRLDPAGRTVIARLPPASAAKTPA
jgi:UDP-2,3-diacylglucosamine hydrolase